MKITDVTVERSSVSRDPRAPDGPGLGLELDEAVAASLVAEP